MDEEIEAEGFSRVLRINGKEASGYADLPTEILLAHLPFAFHPKPENAVVIGFGGGNYGGVCVIASIKRSCLCRTKQRSF